MLRGRCYFLVYAENVKGRVQFRVAGEGFLQVDSPLSEEKRERKGLTPKDLVY